VLASPNDTSRQYNPARLQYCHTTPIIRKVGFYGCNAAVMKKEPSSNVCCVMAEHAVCHHISVSALSPVLNMALCRSKVQAGPIHVLDLVATLWPHSRVPTGATPYPHYPCITTVIDCRVRQYCLPLHFVSSSNNRPYPSLSLYNK
jgi:hypothetical protein